MNGCLFCKFVRGEAPHFKIWEDAKHLAFLTPFPNTPGFSVVITKEHQDSYGFAVSPSVLTELILAARQVAQRIDKNLGVARTGLIMEGYGINHLHVKLVPMHGIDQVEWQPINSTDRTFYPRYIGMLSSNDGPRMPDAELEAIAAKIRGEATKTGK